MAHDSLGLVAAIPFKGAKLVCRPILSLLLARLKAAGRLLLAASLFAAAASLLVWQRSAAQQRHSTSRPEDTARGGKRSPDQLSDKGPARVDELGDPLPHGAMARMGTARLRGEVITFAPDGKALITFGADRAFHYWDVNTGKELDCKHLSFVVDPSRWDVVHLTRGRSANGRLYVSLDRETIRVWDTANGKELCKIPNPKLSHTFFYRLAVTNDGQTVAASILDIRAQKRPVNLWNAQTGKKRELFFAGADGSYPAFSPDGKILALGSESGLIRLHDTASLKEVGQIKSGPAGRNPTAPVFSPDGHTLAWMDGVEAVRLWNVADGVPKGVFQTPGIGKGLTLQFSQDGKRLALAGEKQIVIWDLTARKELRKIPVSHLADFRFVLDHLAFAPDGRTLAVGSSGGARLYDVVTGKLLLQTAGYAGNHFCLAFSPGGETLAAATWQDPTIRLWETATGKPLLSLKTPGFTNSLLFSRDGKLLITGGLGQVHFWNLRNGQHLRVLEFNDKFDKRKYGVRRLSCNGKVLIARGGTFDPQLRALRERVLICDLETNTVRKRYDFPGSFLSLAAPNETTLHLLDHSILRDALTGKQVVRLRQKSYGPWHFSRDSKKLAIGCYRASADSPIPSERLARAVSIYDLGTGRELGRIETGLIGDVAFSPDGKLLASASRQDLSLWEIATGQCVYRLPAPPGLSAADGVAFCTVLAFAPDGKSLATALKDTTILIWDTAPGFRRAAAQPTRLSGKALEQLWAAMGGDNAAKAYDAIWRLAASPRQAVLFLKQRLKPATDKTKLISKLIADLGKDQFAVRHTAFKELQRFDIEIEPAVRKGLAVPPSEEVRRRLELLLARPSAIVRGAEVLRCFRAIQTLEIISSPESREVLRVLARGPAQYRLTQEAKTSLERMELIYHP